MFNPIMITIPKPIIAKIEELNQIVENNPEYIPIAIVAKFLGVSPDGLRCSIQRGGCAFGISWQREELKGKSMLPCNRAFKVPTVTFYLWYTTGLAVKITN